MRIRIIYFFTLLLTTLSISTSYAYEVVDEKLTVSPGCTGGVLYSIIESGDMSFPINIENEFDDEEDSSSVVQE